MNRREALKTIGKGIVAGAMAPLVSSTPQRGMLPSHHPSSRALTQYLAEPKSTSNTQQRTEPSRMNRRDALALMGAGLLFGIAYATPESNTSAPQSIDEIVRGGSDERKIVMGNLVDGQRLMRHDTNLRPEAIRAYAQGQSDYAFTPGDRAQIELTQERIAALGLEGHLQATARKANIDPDFYLVKISTESVGDPYAVSSAGALGIAQILPNTYETVGEHIGIRDHTNGMIRRVRQTIPAEVLTDLLERPLRDTLLITREMAEEMGIPLDYDALWMKDVDKHLNTWLPYVLTVMREYGEFPGTGRGTYDVLTDPRTSIEAGALITLNFWLTTRSPTKAPNLAYHNHDPGNALIAPVYPLVPQAPASAYVRGENGVHGTMTRLVDRDEPYTLLEGMEAFSDLNTSRGRIYSAELLRKYEHLKRTHS